MRQYTLHLADGDCGLRILSLSGNYYFAGHGYFLDTSLAHSGPPPFDAAQADDPAGSRDANEDLQGTRRRARDADGVRSHQRAGATTSAGANTT